MAMYYNGKKVRNLYYNGKCITRLALGKEMTRLVEGDDFVRADWLVGDGTAYIDTLINPSFGDELNATFTLSSKPTKVNIYIFSATDNVNSISFLTGGDFYGSGNPQLLIINKPTSTNGYIVWNAASLGTTIKEYYMYMKINNSQMPDMIVKADGVICNYNSTVGDNRISEVPTTSYKIGRGYSIQTGLDTVKLKNITILSKINLIPVRLLRPLPSYLDANGKARQAGECGMYDSVSGKFFGNVANAGTFTVSDN